MKLFVYYKNILLLLENDMMWLIKHDVVCNDDAIYVYAEQISMCAKPLVPIWTR